MRLILCFTLTVACLLNAGCYHADEIENIVDSDNNSNNDNGDDNNGDDNNDDDNEDDNDDNDSGADSDSDSDVDSDIDSDSDSDVPLDPAAEILFSGSVIDSSVNNYNCIAHGGEFENDRFGNNNSAYSFDGIDDWVEVEGGSGLAGETITSSAWVYFTKDMDHGIVIDKIANSGANEENYGTTVDSCVVDVRTEDARDDADYNILYKSDDIELSGWVHTVEVLTEDELKIYINGTLKETETLPSGFIPYTGDCPLMIGGRPYNNGVSGYLATTLDDIRIYKRVLSQEEISALFHEEEWGQ